MRIGTALFTYCRGDHTKEVLESLYSNKILPKKLFVFQDGFNANTDMGQWKQVNDLIMKIDWCDCEIVVADRNYGLRRAIVKGINYVLEDYDAVIVIEDDCILHPLFMEYMYEGFQKYIENRSVYVINGYGYDLDIPQNGTDAYFSGRVSSWGWGTWKDRWLEYEEDYEILTRIKKNENLNQQLHFWGEDLQRYLHRNIEGKCDSWAVFWALKIIEKGGYCLSPYKSLVSNIGVDGSGTHCGSGILKERVRSWDDMDELTLPDHIEITKECQKEYSRYFAWMPDADRSLIYNNILHKWIVMLKQGKSIIKYLTENRITKVSVWGLGRIGNMVIEELIENKIKVLSVILTKPYTLQIMGIPVVDKHNIPKQTELIIVIPVYDFERIYGGLKDECKCMVMGIDKLINNCINDSLKGECND